MSGFATRARAALAWLGQRERGVLVALIVLVGGAWLFAELADEVLEGSTGAVDERLLLLFRNSEDLSDPIGPAWAEEAARDITGLGGVGFLTLLTLASAGYLALQRKAHLAWYVLIAVGGGIAASTLLKLAFDRPRPELVPHGQIVYTSSFPSGHSMMSAVTFLTLGVLLASVQPNNILKAYLLALAVLLSVSVGISRVYLGVHWPSDVLGGWTAGAVWALMCWSFARYLRRRGTLESGTLE
ncbi:MAG: phosphatase PAP2 family protein [Gammaproteobacteria bacterium]|nr:phosphatase PAP2 family protein [Gammaproteobacteria bacterium]